MTTENTRSKAQRGGEQSPPKCRTQPDRVVLQERLRTLVREQVLHALGEPHNLFQVHIQPLRDANYRVNVFVCTNAANAKIPYSYFVEADDDG